MYKFDITGKVWEEASYDAPEGKKIISFMFVAYDNSTEDEDEIKSSIEWYLEQKCPEDKEYDIDFDYGFLKDYYEDDGGPRQNTCYVTITLSDKVDEADFANEFKAYALPK